MGNGMVNNSSPSSPSNPNFDRNDNVSDELTSNGNSDHIESEDNQTNNHDHLNSTESTINGNGHTLESEEILTNNHSSLNGAETPVDKLNCTNGDDNQTNGDDTHSNSSNHQNGDKNQSEISNIEENLLNKYSCLKCRVSIPILPLNYPHKDLWLMRKELKRNRSAVVNMPAFHPDNVLQLKLKLESRSDNLIQDPNLIYEQGKSTAKWSRNEKILFRELILKYPKEFSRIAPRMERKTVKDCVLYYYLSKKKVNYKNLKLRLLRRKERLEGLERKTSVLSTFLTTGSLSLPSLLPCRVQLRNIATASKPSKPSKPAAKPSKPLFRSPVSLKKDEPSLRGEGTNTHKSSEVKPVECEPPYKAILTESLPLEDHSLNSVCLNGQHSPKEGSYEDMIVDADWYKGEITKPEDFDLYMIRDQTSSKPTCSICLQFSNPNPLHVRHHIERTHFPKTFLYNCTKCGANVRTKYALKKHITRCGAVRPYVCELCGKKFRTPRQLHELHLKRGNCPKKYQCFTCVESPYFSKRRDLKAHNVHCHAAALS